MIGANKEKIRRTVRNNIVSFQKELWTNGTRFWNPISFFKKISSSALLKYCSIIVGSWEGLTAEQEFEVGEGKEVDKWGWHQQRLREELRDRIMTLSDNWWARERERPRKESSFLCLPHELANMPEIMSFKHKERRILDFRVDRVCVQD